MAIYPIQNEPIPVNTYGIIPTGQQGGNGGKIVQGTGDLPGKDSFSQNLSTWSELQKINDSSNEVAQKQQTRDKILKGVGDYADRMKAQLGRIIKNFPPFPPESKDRIMLLRSYSGFRKLIDQLTIPPPEDSTVGAETSKVLSPADSVPSATQPGDMTPGNLKA
jgi:hypothetical protein